MTRRLEEAAEVETEGSSVFRPGLLTRKAKRRARQSDTELRSTIVAPSRHRRAADCSHHWEIEAALRPMSTGVCRHCGEERLFRNQLEWEEISPARSITGSRQANDETKTPGRGRTGEGPPAWRQMKPISLQRVLAGY